MVRVERRRGTVAGWMAMGLMELGAAGDCRGQLTAPQSRSSERGNALALVLAPDGWWVDYSAASAKNMWQSCDDLPLPRRPRCHARAARPHKHRRALHDRSHCGAWIVLPVSGVRGIFLAAICSGAKRNPVAGSDGSIEAFWLEAAQKLRSAPRLRSGCRASAFRAPAGSGPGLQFELTVPRCSTYVPPLHRHPRETPRCFPPGGCCGILCVSPRRQCCCASRPRVQPNETAGCGGRNRAAGHRRVARRLAKTRRLDSSTPA